MNAKLLPLTPAIKDWLNQASSQLISAGITSANLDAELILAYSLVQERTYLHAHPEQIINNKQYKLANRNLFKRLKNTPIAYITGHKEFYGRDFMVNKNTLIPRPESEDIIDTLKSIIHNRKSTGINLIDIGTGSGCLGITAKLEFNYLNVTLADISKKALDVAQENAIKLAVDVTLIKSDLLKKYHKTPDIILANLPYVNKSWDRSPDTNHEPSLALFANNNGLSIIFNLILQASNLLSAYGFLIIEADPIQHKSIIKHAKLNNLKLISCLGYALAFQITNPR